MEDRGGAAHLKSDACSQRSKLVGQLKCQFPAFDTTHFTNERRGVGLQNVGRSTTRYSSWRYYRVQEAVRLNSQSLNNQSYPQLNMYIVI